MKSELREKLLTFLLVTADMGGGDQEATHSEAETLLLMYLDDPDITVAWEEAARFWWYA